MDSKAGVTLSGHSAVTLPTDELARHCSILIDGTQVEALDGERLIDALNRDSIARNRKEVPQVCYHPHLGPIQTCDTCMVEIDGKLGRACAATVAAGMKVVTESAAATAAQREAFAFPPCFPYRGGQTALRRTLGCRRRTLFWTNSPS